MRITVLFLVFIIFLGLASWASLGGATLLVSWCMLALVIIAMVYYADLCVLFFLRAREIMAIDEGDLYSAAVQEAFKLSLNKPKVFFYNGSIERGFVLQNKQAVSLVLNKGIIRSCSKDELSAICFELLLQVKKGMALKRTRTMFLVGLLSWLNNLLESVIVSFIPFKSVRMCLRWMNKFFFSPFVEMLFKLSLGKSYFRKTLKLLSEFPQEYNDFLIVASKLRRSNETQSLLTKRIIEFTDVAGNNQFQSMTTLEFLPHEWDLISDKGVEISV